MAEVISLARSARHHFSKTNCDELRLIAGEGVEGDAHRGSNVQHLSRVAADPAQPNLRQVHLIHGELLDELAIKGFQVEPGDIGENITTKNIDLLALPVGTKLSIGECAILQITGLRNPCHQLNKFADGLMDAVLERSSDGALVRKAGIMSIVLQGGLINVGDTIAVDLPESPHQQLKPV